MAFPLDPLPDQFQHPANKHLVQETAALMHAAVDLPLDALAAFMLGMPTAQLASFRAVHRIAATQALAIAPTTLKWNTVLNDSAGAYNAGTGIYTIPPAGGLFLLSMQVMWAQAVTGRIFFNGMNTSWWGGGTRLTGGALSTADGRSSRVEITPMRFAGGEQVSIQSTIATTLAAVIATTDQHFVELVQIGF